MSGDEHNENRVLGGHKATLHNPSSSEAAKEHAREVLREHGVEIDENGTSTEKTKTPKSHAEAEHKGHTHSEPSHAKADGESDDQHNHRVLGGYKATLSNSSTSEEAKEHAREKLREAGEDY